MCRHINLFVWIIISGAMLSACQPLLPGAISKELTCAQIIVPDLTAYIDHEVNPELLAEVIKRLYLRNDKDVVISVNDDKSWAITWIGDGGGYGAFSEDGLHLNQIGVDFTLFRPTAQQLIDCIKHQPEWYWAGFGPNTPTRGIRSSFVMYFPSQGVVAIATGASKKSEPLASVSPDIPLSHLVMTRPGTLSTLYYQTWGDPLERERMALHPLPWPSQWDMIQYVEDQGLGW